MRYSISDLENLSGVKAHTIRIWEQRYQLLNPSRTDTNIRFYTNDQLRKLMNVVSLMRSGMKISKISKLSTKEMFNHLETTLIGVDNVEVQHETQVNMLVSSGLSFDEVQFNKIFSNCILRYGLKDTYIKILHPLLTKIGLMWGRDELYPSQEHFISNIVRQKLFTAIDGLPEATDSEKWLLFLPEHEDHEIGLLFGNYIIRQHSKKVIYLGNRVPFSNLKHAITEYKPECLFTFLVQTRPLEELQAYINDLSNLFKDKTIILSGNHWVIDELQLPNNVIYVNNVHVMIERFLK